MMSPLSTEIPFSFKVSIHSRWSIKLTCRLKINEQVHSFCPLLTLTLFCLQLNLPRSFCFIFRCSFFTFVYLHEHLFTRPKTMKNAKMNARPTAKDNHKKKNNNNNKRSCVCANVVGPIDTTHSIMNVFYFWFCDSNFAIFLHLFIIEFIDVLVCNKFFILSVINCLLYVTWVLRNSFSVSDPNFINFEWGAARNTNDLTHRWR